MKTKISFSGMLNWLATTKMFVRPSKKIPGKWVLFEFYYEPGKELIHKTQEQLTAEKIFWEIEFVSDEKYVHNSNLDIPVISEIMSGIWSLSRNFITLINPHNFHDNVEFQFAIEKDNLKLLKKDVLGKIQFFGFFKKSNSR